jgi:hypothetical protein
MAVCSICGKAHNEITHIVSTIKDYLPSKLLSKMSSTANEAYAKTKIDSLLRTLKNAATELSTLVSDPVAFVSFYFPVIASLEELLTPAETLAIYSKIGASLVEIFSGSSNAALKRYISVVLVAEKARAISGATIETTAEATALRTEIVNEIDALMLEMPDDATFGVLAELKAAVVEAIDELKSQAKTTSKYLVSQPQNIYPIAYRIYGDASRADELVERNGIKNPALVPGGTVLEVLS